MTRAYRLWLPPIYAGLGFLAMWLPWRLAFASGRVRASNPVDGMQLISLAFLAPVGALGGLLAPRASPWLAMSSMAAFPLFAFVDMLQDPTSHNLWPMEFAIYGAVSLLAVAGAAAGSRLRRKTRRDPAP